MKERERELTMKGAADPTRIEPAVCASPVELPLLDDAVLPRPVTLVAVEARLCGLVPNHVDDERFDVAAAAKVQVVTLTSLDGDPFGGFVGVQVADALGHVDLVAVAPRDHLPGGPPLESLVLVRLVGSVSSGLRVGGRAGLGRLGRLVRLLGQDGRLEIRSEDGDL